MIVKNEEWEIKEKERKRKYYLDNKKEVILRSKNYYHSHKTLHPRKKIFWHNLSGVYEFICLPTNKRYIGRSTHLRVRRSMHLSRLRKQYYKDRDFQKDFNLYGEENFTFKPIVICEEDDTKKYEQYFVDLYKENDLLYNRAIEDVDTCKGIKHTEETKAKRRKPVTPECKKKLKEIGKLRRTYSNLIQIWENLHYNQGLKFDQIAKMYGTNFHTVKKYITKYAKEVDC
jgi:group I intron endonuclease